MLETEPFFDKLFRRDYQLCLAGAIIKSANKK
jgi:hypothetical protein